MRDYYPFWTMDSFGSEYPPENAREIIAEANMRILRAERDIGMGAAARLSNELWERFCRTGSLD